MGRPAKLTDAQVAEIRARLAIARAHARKRIAADYGVSTAMVSAICNGRYAMKLRRAAREQ